MKSALRKIYSKLSLKTAALFERAKMTEHTFMIISAIIIGVLAGFSAIGIRAMIKFFSDVSFPGSGNHLQNIMNTPWFHILLLPIIGGLIVGPIIYYFAPEAKGHGVPEVMQAILLKGGQIRGRVAIVKALASSITIGTGGSVGREGPIVQIGSSLGSVVGQFLRVSSRRLKTLVGCGAAAGIAAAFNAPIAGALFAVEIVLMDFTVAQFSPIVISSVMATVISHTFEGNFAAFTVPVYQLAPPLGLGFYFVLGAASGLVSFLFIKVLYWCEDLFDNYINVPEFYKPALGGAGVGLIALLFPQVLGLGYESINNALYGNILWYFALALIFMKIFATALTLGSGGSGGIFTPSLYMGAMLGSFFGYVVNFYFPNLSASPGAYALVAMGGLVAGATRAPITAIIIVFEMTNDYNVILPLMITCIISVIISSKLSRESIYTLKLVLKNIGLKDAVETNVMESIYVKDVYKKEFESINTTENFGQIVNKIIAGKESEFPVIDSEGRVSGMISINDIKDYLYERESLQNVLIAGDILNTYFETITTDETCQSALDKLRKYSFNGLPVVNNKNSGHMIGIIWRKDILDAYDREIEKRELTSNLASLIVMKEEEPAVHFMEGYSIIEIPPPKSFIDKSIKELNIRKHYGVDVLSIRIKEKKGEKINAIPSPEYIIKADDTLIIAGEIKNINFIRNLG
ncbi:MAG TPA: chloride channel protein [Ignavibacteriaceae bacterium]|nr:chloride channel protein [Ignavibacteriaceae bacterium]